MSSRRRLNRRDLRHAQPDGPLAVAGGDPGQADEQFAALPWRRQADGSLKVLLVTSRETRRWVIPKGWPIKGRTPAESAVQEAYEEAGLVGEPDERPVGVYTYGKRLRDGAVRPVTVTVFAMEALVERLAFPEQGQRKKLWTDPAKAAQLVEEPELAAILSAFRPRP